MIPAEIGHTLIIAAIVLAVIWACHRVWRGITQAREPEPETHGDDGGRPSYGNQLTNWEAGD